MLMGSTVISPIDLIFCMKSYIIPRINIQGLAQRSDDMT